MAIEYRTVNGIEYAMLSKSVRKGDRITKAPRINLGRVIDKERGIYKSRARGLFHYDPDAEEYSKVPPDYIEPMIKRRKKTRDREILEVEFGSSFFFNSYMQALGCWDILDAVLYRNNDTLRALLMYYCVAPYSNRMALLWWNHSYARMLFPKAQLASQRISETLEDLGSEEVKRLFFKAYYKKLKINPARKTTYAYEMDDEAAGEGILIDSTGLPNCCSLPVTAVSNHNGQISEEIRLIYVVQQSTGLPLFFRYIAGNIIDATTIKTTVAEIKAYGINTKFAILDAGYYNHKNADALIEAGISFITRMHSGFEVYDQVFTANRSTLEEEENLVTHNGRIIYVKCVPCKIGSKRDHDAYAYMCLDCTMKREEEYKLQQRISDTNLSSHEIHTKRSQHGIFMLVATRKIAKANLLPLYYTRNQVEDIFKLCKSSCKILPINVETEETLRGHLLLTFMATVVMKRISDRLADKSFTTEMLFMALNEHRARIYEDCIVTSEPTKLMNNIYKHYKITVPTSIPYEAPAELFEEINNVGADWLMPDDNVDTKISGN